MTDFNIFNLVLLPLGLGLIGFIEPCTVGSSLLFIKYLEGKSAFDKLLQTGIFVLTRALFIGVLGMTAALVGNAFLTFQKGAWMVLGGIYALIGVLFVLGKAKMLMVTLGPHLSRISKTQGPVSLGVLFGFNIPACAAPLIFVVLGAAAIGPAESRAIQGFVTLALFGLALSLPLAVMVLVPSGRSILDRLANFSSRTPFWIGLLFIALGLWSIFFGVFVSLEEWQ